MNGPGSKTHQSSAKQLQLEGAEQLQPGGAEQLQPEGLQPEGAKQLQPRGAWNESLPPSESGSLLRLKQPPKELT